nr:MAG TPA: hypothetical protein [Caudoviricetes sp.]
MPCYVTDADRCHFFVERCGLCAATLFSDRGRHRPPCSNRGAYITPSTI